MNVEVENSLPESLEQLLSRHRKEKKDLQNKIQALKKSATKGDKKKKKEVSEEILKLESELQSKQSVEVATMSNGEVDILTGEVKALNVTEGDEKTSPPAWRTTKAAKRRAKKEMLLKEQELRIAEQESLNIDGPRNVEMQIINSALKDRGLMILEIPSDGDCMYNAVLAGLNGAVADGVTGVRKAAANILRTHMDEFLPFLSHPDTGEMLTEPQYASYCNQVESTNAWGGHIELKAVSQGLECCIEVIQSNSDPVIIGPQYKEKSHVIVTYHKHLYRLGEHYNSVQPYISREEEENGED